LLGAAGMNPGPSNSQPDAMAICHGDPIYLMSMGKSQCRGEACMINPTGFSPEAAWSETSSQTRQIETQKIY